MDVKIYLEPKEAWGFFQKNEKRMEDEMVVIAENVKTKYSIYITNNDKHEPHSPLLLVYKDDLKIYEEGIADKDDCADTAEELYLRYLFPTSLDHKSRLLKTYLECAKSGEITDNKIRGHAPLFDRRSKNIIGQSVLLKASIDRQTGEWRIWDDVDDTWVYASELPGTIAWRIWMKHGENYLNALDKRPH